MRKTVLAAAAAFVAGGIATGALLAEAQPAPPPPADGPAAQMAAPHGWMGWRHHPHPGLAGMAPFALIYREPDRQLAPADVQKIAEAFLLWNGNHSWKVTDVAATPEGPIAFNLTTPEGSVVAKFAMDPHTARISRLS